MSEKSFKTECVSDTDEQAEIERARYDISNRIFGAYVLPIAYKEFFDEIIEPVMLDDDDKTAEPPEVDVQDVRALYEVYYDTSRTIEQAVDRFDCRLKQAYLDLLGDDADEIATQLRVAYDASDIRSIHMCVDRIDARIRALEENATHEWSGYIQQPLWYDEKPERTHPYYGQGYSARRHIPRYITEHGLAPTCIAKTGIVSALLDKAGIDYCYIAPRRDQMTHTRAQLGGVVSKMADATGSGELYAYLETLHNNHFAKIQMYGGAIHLAVVMKLPDEEVMMIDLNGQKSVHCTDSVGDLNALSSNIKSYFDPAESEQARLVTVYQPWGYSIERIFEHTNYDQLRSRVYELLAPRLPEKWNEEAYASEVRSAFSAVVDAHAEMVGEEGEVFFKRLRDISDNGALCSGVSSPWNVVASAYNADDVAEVSVRALDLAELLEATKMAHTEQNSRADTLGDGNIHTVLADEAYETMKDTAQIRPGRAGFRGVMGEEQKKYYTDILTTRLPAIYFNVLAHLNDSMLDFIGKSMEIPYASYELTGKRRTIGALVLGLCAYDTKMKNSRIRQQSPELARWFDTMSGDFWPTYIPLGFVGDAFTIGEVTRLQAKREECLEHNLHLNYEYRNVVQ